MTQSKVVAITLVCVLSLVTVCIAQRAAGPVHTDPEKAGVDFQIQGEYEGMDVEGDEWGAQIIALGEGKFASVGYHGGLPGAGWDGEAPRKAEGQITDGVATFEGDEYTVKVKDDVLEVFDFDGASVAKLKKVHRKSPTLGKKPPEGALVLFDGTSTDAWENATMVEGKWLGASSCATKKKLGDHTLHIEFRTPFMPEARGQGRGNSGVYVQGRYEVQVLDSFGLEGKDNECGGIYSINQPKVNMCYPPLSWQTYDIDFKQAEYDKDGNKTKNARATIRHNGVVIHDDLELTKGTPGRYREGPGPEALFLQNHGNPVVFRNIWVVEN